MRRWMFGGVSAVVVALSLLWLGGPSTTEGQPNRPGRPGRPGPMGQPNQGNQNGRGNAQEDKGYQPPADPKLQKIHDAYLTEASKLVTEYSKDRKNFDKLRAVCEDILRVMPKHPGATDMLRKIREEESNAGTEKFEVLATKGWQDTGIIVQEGKPIAIKAAGSWTFTIETDLGPGGMEIPEAWREFQLGSLIGAIYVPGGSNEPKPFAVGEGVEFTAEQTGQLFLKMHDTNPEDNKGKMQVEIKGTFKKGKAGA